MSSFFLCISFSLFYRSKPRPASQWKRSFLSLCFPIVFRFVIGQNEIKEFLGFVASLGYHGLPPLVCHIRHFWIIIRDVRKRSSVSQIRQEGSTERHVGVHLVGNLIFTNKRLALMLIMLVATREKSSTQRQPLCA